MSDSRASGERADETTALVRERLEAGGLEVAREALVPDERGRIVSALRELCDSHRLALVVTTGGTGLAARDVTPEATRAVIDREAPGIAEMLRARTAAATPYAWLSRGVAGTRGTTLIVNLPGSPRAVGEYLDELVPLLDHALDVLCTDEPDHPS